MIKINLLESITDRPTGAAMVEARVSTPFVQTLLLGLTVFGLLIVALGYNYVSTRSAHTAAEAELQTQRQINQQMLAVNKEQAELDKKAQDIQGRIDAIKRLRGSQTGPTAILRDIKARFDSVPGVYFESLEQKDNQLTIKGFSPSETAVAQFGKLFEFSDGLFTNLNIETVRENSKGAGDEKTETRPDAVVIVQHPEVVSFIVKCTYSPTPPPQAASKPAANQVALKK
ncbi:MAG TPA: PilN domain-containing protein [Pyrinomonadaceae bacterium]|jgi:Tfp pilus assembly protein PilN